MAVSAKAVFIDKDGTLIEDVPYNVDPQRIRLTAGAVRGLQRLQRLGYLLIGVSNQPGIALGHFTETALDAAVRHLRALLAESSVQLAGFYYCPHDPAGRSRRYAMHCRCRKPEPGLLFTAAYIHDIDLHQSWLIGDILNDVEAGAHAGCRTVLLDNGNETEWKRGPFREPSCRARDLAEAARCIEEIDTLDSMSDKCRPGVRMMRRVAPNSGGPLRT